MKGRGEIVAVGASSRNRSNGGSGPVRTSMNTPI